MPIIIVLGIIIGYFLNNYTLTVSEETKGNPLKPVFDRKVTPIILFWNILIPILLYYGHGGNLSTGFFRDFTLSALFSAIIFIDAKHYIIPNVLNLIGFVIGIILLIINPINTSDYLIGATIGLSFFVIIILLSKLILKKEGMGLGDAKLMCAVGILFGTLYTILTIMMSFIFASIGVTISLLTKRKKFGQEIAFGPYIVIAGMVTMFFGENIILAYLNLLC